MPACSSCGRNNHRPTCQLDKSITSVRRHFLKLRAYKVCAWGGCGLPSARRYYCKKHRQRQHDNDKRLKDYRPDQGNRPTRGRARPQAHPPVPGAQSGDSHGTD